MMANASVKKYESNRMGTVFVLILLLYAVAKSLTNINGQAFFTGSAYVVLEFLIFAVVLFIQYRTISTKGFVAAFIITIVLIFYYLLSQNSGVGMVITICTYLMPLVIVKKIRCSKKVIYTAIIWFAIIWFTLLFAKGSLLDATHRMRLDLNFIKLYVNPNQNGIIALLACGFAMAALKNKKIILKFAITALAVLISLHFSCRSAILSIGVMWIFYLLFLLLPRLNVRTIIFAAFAFEVLFIFAYNQLYLNGADFATFLGKQVFSGRQTYWIYGMSFINLRSVWFGIGNLDFEPHNFILNLILSYGVFISIIIVMGICKTVPKQDPTKKGDHLLLYCLLIAIVFENAFEVIPFEWIVITLIMMNKDGATADCAEELEPFIEGTRMWKT